MDYKFNENLNIRAVHQYIDNTYPQHYAHSKFRSIEQGKALIRAANNGISAIINPNGKIKSLIELEETGSIYTNEIKHKVTLFSKYGNKMYFVLIFIYIFLLLSIRRLDHE